MVNDGEAVGPWRIQNGLLIFKEKIYLAEDSSLIGDIIGQFHNSTHEGFLKSLNQIQSTFYWKGMRKQIKEYNKNCDICQRHKVEHLTPAGRLLQTLQVPSQVWEDISMDFIDRFLPSKGKSTTIVVVDHLSKYAHFTAISHPYTAMGVVKVLFDQIFRLHGMPRSIVCDRDPTFTSRFWRELFCLNGTDFNFSSAYHPQLMVKVRW